MAGGPTVERIAKLIERGLAQALTAIHTAGMSQVGSLAYLTEGWAGIGGRLKVREGDFLVEEQPAYEPSGRGEHLFLFVEKTGRTTSDVVRTLAKAFRVSRGAVGYAGLKDKRAVTRQYFSVHLPGRTDEAEGLRRLEVQQTKTLKVLWADRHENKLRRGHLAGNRFVIRLREVAATDVLSAKRVLDHLEAGGVANYVGGQRFGYRQNGHVIGRHLLLGQWQRALAVMLGEGHEEDSPGLAEGRRRFQAGDYAEALAVWPRTLRFDRQALDALRQGADAWGAVRAIDRSQRSLYVSAWQSDVFNRVLDARIRAGTFDRLLAGDLAWKHDSRAVFLVDEATAGTENAAGGRVPRHEVSPSGPMWGMRMTQASGQVGQTERAALAAGGLGVEQLGGAGDVGAEGARRPLRVFLRDAEVSGGVDEDGAYVRVAFELPRGAFATMVLREMMKDGRRGAVEDGNA